MRHNSDASLSQKEMSKILTELGLDTYQHASALSEKEWYFCRPENKKTLIYERFFKIYLLIKAINIPLQSFQRCS
jgi:hypothetical protein